MTKKLITISVLFLIAASAVSAQIQTRPTKTALGINPAIMEVVLDKNKQFKKQIQLYNLTNFPLPVKVMAESFTPKEKLEMTPQQVRIFDASSWITIDERNRDFILQPLENRTISLTIIPPVNASPGGHYASIVFQPMIPEAVVSNESVYVFARVATLVFMGVKGDVRENIGIRNIDIKDFYQTAPDTIKITLKNTGNTHLRPQGSLIIYDKLNGKTVGKFPIAPAIILPGTEKDYSVDTSALQNKVGVFVAKAEVTYGAGNLIVTSPNITFYVFPYIWLSLGAAIMALLTFVFFKIRHRLKKALRVLISGDLH